MKTASIEETPTTFSRPFLAITMADFIVRSAYQMGKTPLLPLFAASLGATDIYLGFIVSVSTLTGMFLKPAAGLLSDRWGRRLWLLFGTTLFVAVPFFYPLIQNPEQLLTLRLIHGTATAIYGPVTVAYVVESMGKRRGESLGWFGMARSGGYIIGPALGGWFLLVLSPQNIFVVIGLISLIAFLPIMILKDTNANQQRKKDSWQEQFKNALNTAFQSFALWFVGGLEMVMYIGVYAIKAFLPIYALTIGLSVVQVGLYFAIQEGVTVLVKPFCGRLGDRYGHFKVVLLGMVLLASALFLIGAESGIAFLFLTTILIGLAQGLISPNTIVLLSHQLSMEHLGTGMGILGTLQNGSKVIGPLMAGWLLRWLDYTGMFMFISYMMMVAIISLYFIQTDLYASNLSRPWPQFQFLSFRQKNPPSRKM